MVQVFPMVGSTSFKVLQTWSDFFSGVKQLVMQLFIGLINVCDCEVYC